MKNFLLLLVLITFARSLDGQTRAPQVSRFQYHLNSRSQISLAVDTALTGSQYHLPLYMSPDSWSDLGNAGLPAIINQYRPVRDALNPIAFEAIDGYGWNNPSLFFYGANSPFSMLNYNSGGTADKNGQTIKALFARNLKRKGNITVLGTYNNADGHFNRQKCNSSDMRVNYILNRTNYSMVTGLSRNSFKYNENGGLASADELATAYYANLIPVNLSGAAVELSAMTWHGVQTGTFHLGGKKSKSPLSADSLKLDSLMMEAPVQDSLLQDSLLPQLAERRSPLIVHTFKISNVTRKYTDAAGDADFYKNTYSEGKASADSLKFFSWSNKLNILADTISIGRHPVVLEGGLNPDFYRYQFADTTMYGFSFGVNGTMTRRFERSALEVTGQWNALGFAAGDYGLKGSFSRPAGPDAKGIDLMVEVFARGASPDPFIRDFSSNHFRWSTDFLRQHEAGFNAGVTFPRIRAAVEAGIVNTVNRIYFDSTGLPAQFTKAMSVFSFKAAKEFRAGALRSKLSGLVQYSTSDILRLPLFVGTTSTFMHHDITFKSTGGAIEVEYGFDLTYTTAFHGYAFMPAIGVFMLQNDRLLGNYPHLNVFAQMKVKRTRLFVQWCHTFADLLPEQSFAVLNYPSMRPHLKYGIYWHFYD